MALSNCIKCGHQVSTFASFCPNKVCGVQKPLDTEYHRNNRLEKKMLVEKAPEYVIQSTACELNKHESLLATCPDCGHTEDIYYKLVYVNLDPYNNTPDNKNIYEHLLDSKVKHVKNKTITCPRCGRPDINVCKICRDTSLEGKKVLLSLQTKQVGYTIKLTEVMVCEDHFCKTCGAVCHDGSCPLSKWHVEHYMKLFHKKRSLRLLFQKNKRIGVCTDDSHSSTVYYGDDSFFGYCNCNGLHLSD